MATGLNFYSAPTLQQLELKEDRELSLRDRSVLLFYIGGDELNLILPEISYPLNSVFILVNKGTANIILTASDGDHTIAPNGSLVAIMEVSTKQFEFYSGGGSVTPALTGSITPAQPPNDAVLTED